MSDTTDPNLVTLKAKLALIKDRVRGVAQGWSTGLYLWGDGGTSKTWSVEQALKSLNKAYKLTNSRLTGKGLFELLKMFPTTLHVLDDLETLLGDKNAPAVLRSALWATPDDKGRMDRLVVWQTARGRETFTFTGGIIMIANLSINNTSPVLRALASRIAVVHHQPTQEELVALMEHLAKAGYKYRGISLTPDECHEIVDHVVWLLGFLERPIDMRLFVNGRMDRCQEKAGQTEIGWRDLLESRVKQTAPKMLVERQEPKLKVV